MIRSDHSRGTGINPENRFKDSSYIPDDKTGYSEKKKTRFYPDHAATVLSSNNSPDIPFSYSINPYRGCEHGCIYCYARPTHEYLDLSSGIDFETKIFYKKDIGKKLKQELQKPSWNPQSIAISGVTDPYQPAENKYRLTREVLETLLEFRNPAAIITKNKLILRDLDLLKAMSEHNLIHVNLSVTTLNADLARIMEPRTSLPRQRLETIQQLSEAGISCGVMVAPVIPGLTDHEMIQIIEEAYNHGARHAGYIVMRLPHSVKDLFQNWVKEHYPDRFNKIIHRIESIRNGKLNSTEFGERMKGQGPFAKQINTMFNATIKRLDMNKSRPPLNCDDFRVPGRAEQMELF